MGDDAFLESETCPPTAAVLGQCAAIQPSRYKAKVDSVWPRDRRLTFEQEHDECMLGVSLENSNFVRAKLTAMLEWIVRRFPRCTVLVGDSIHRITVEAKRQLAPEAALVEALRLGRAFIADEAQVFDGFRSRTAFSFVTCSEIQGSEAYCDYHTRLRALFDSDATFRSSVESFGLNYHSKNSRHVSDGERAKRIQRSSDYFLEEFAIFSCLRKKGIGVMVYPGTFSTLAEVADGQHPDAPKELRDLVVVSLHMRGKTS